MAWQNPDYGWGQRAPAPLAGGDPGGAVSADLSLGSRGFSEGVRSPADRRAVGGARPQPSVGQDLLDDLGLVNEGDDPHRSPTLGTEQRSDLIHVFGRRERMCEHRRNSPRWPSICLVDQFAVFHPKRRQTSLDQRRTATGQRGRMVGNPGPLHRR